MSEQKTDSDGSDRDSDMEIVKEVDANGKEVKRNVSSEDREQAINELKAFVGEAARKQGGADGIVQDAGKKRSFVAAMYCESTVKELLHKAGGGLGAPAAKRLLQQFLQQVKVEKQTDEEQAAKILDVARSYFVGVPGGDGYESDDVVVDNSDLAGAVSTYSLTSRAVNYAHDLSNVFTPKQLLPTSEDFERRYSMVMPCAACAPGNRCLLCKCTDIATLGQGCPFKRRSTLHWIRPYEAVVFALWHVELLPESLPLAQKFLIDSIEEKSKEDSFVRSAVCPPIVLEMAKRIKDEGTRPPAMVIKTLLGAAVSALNAKALDALRDKRSGETLAELKAQLMRKDFLSTVDVEEGSEAGASSGDAAATQTCAQLARAQIQCKKHDGCTNQPFADPARKGVVKIKITGTLRGLGLFADTNTQSRQLLGEYKGVPISNRSTDWSYVVKRRDGTFLDGKPVKDNRVKYANHVCEDANCELQEWLVDDKPVLGLFTTKAVLGLFTTKAVAKGDEFVWTYHHNMVTFNCLCGKPGCVRRRERHGN